MLTLYSHLKGEVSFCAFLRILINIQSNLNGAGLLLSAVCAVEPKLITWRNDNKLNSSISVAFSEREDDREGKSLSFQEKQQCRTCCRITVDEPPFRFKKNNCNKAASSDEWAFIPSVCLMERQLRYHYWGSVDMALNFQD